MAAPAPRWTRARLARERAAFFETRVAGRPEVWAALRAAAECLRAGDVATAQGVLDAAGVTVPSGDLVDGAYDEAGALYAVVEWAVADPVNLEEDGGGEEEDEGTERGDEVGGGMEGKGLGLGKVRVTEEGDEAGKRRDEKGKGKSVKKGEGVKVKARLSDRAQDVVVWVGKDESVRSVVNRIREEAMVISGHLDGSYAAMLTKMQIDVRMRIAYMGRVLRENESLAAQGWKEGHVVNALVFQ